MMEQFKKVLVLAPHTDDGEIGAGGLISKLVEQGADVHYVAFSICEESVPIDLPKDILATEVLAATKELGIASINVTVFRFPVRIFPQKRQDILDSMIKLRKSINPDLVLMPAKYDCHQDHFTIYQEGVRAFKQSTMLGYEVPWNNIEFMASLIVKLEDRHIEAKIRSFEKYESQNVRPYGATELVALAKMRGVQVGNNYAEAFNVIRWIWN